MDNCAHCGKSMEAVGGLYQAAFGPHALKFVCFDGLPKEQVDQYPTFRQDVALSRQRAEQARRNFNSEGGKS